MTPAHDHPNRRVSDDRWLSWSAIGKACTAALVAWAAYEFREMRTEFKEMRTTVNSTQRDVAVDGQRINALEKGHQETNERVKRLEAKVFKEDR